MTFARNCALANIIATAFTFIHPSIHSINHHPGADKDRIIIIVYIFFLFIHAGKKAAKSKYFERRPSATTLRLENKTQEWDGNKTVSQPRERMSARARNAVREDDADDEGRTGYLCTCCPFRW